MKALKTELLTLGMALDADRNKVFMYDLDTTMDPIIPADFYLGTRPDNEIRWSIL